MALDKDVLGQALYDKAAAYNEQDIADLEAARLAFWKGQAEEIINHFKAAGVIEVNTTGSSVAQHGFGTIS